ncbi:uncharacterized protein TM35_000031090 [Trypanosoma theileri]|uniref:Uncharacterized protein n=1 Tax=Trypanosoma theileri TaxID=67003 RepID=A0A1X0P5Z6_9TRYP|nr:uncharacterized protein TM35_000031090 [Trypanosoma theileri]ORC92356.1 hypothetical protein TM35_000031090 [Trypanosoma theileri]
MRRAPAAVQMHLVWQLRMYRTPLGGMYFEEPLPSSLFASQAKGGISTAHIAQKRPSRKKRKLSVPLTAEGLKAELRKLTEETAIYSQRRKKDGDIRIDDKPQVEESRREMQQRALRSGVETPTRTVTERSPILVEKEFNEEEGETDSCVLPKCTVLGSDLDQVETDMMRDYHQRGKELPQFDNIYATFGSGRRGKSSYHVFAEEYRQHMGKGRVLGRGEATARTTKGSWGVNLCCNIQQEEEKDVNAKSSVLLPPEANPHFPVEVDSNDLESGTSTANSLSVESSATHILRQMNTNTTNTTTTDTSSSLPPYDAYRQRPADNSLLEIRGIDFWDDANNRQRLQQITDYAEEGNTHDMMAEGPMDTSEVGYSTGRVRKETLLYFQAHPINEMIQEPFVRIRSIVSGDAQAVAQFPAGDVDTDVDLPASQARRMARELGLDLIRVGAIHTEKSERRVVALCIIADHREHMRDMIRFKIQKLGVQPPPTKECIEVPFRGGTHPHAIRFKSIGIAKHLLHGHAVRINLTDFGTPREGFPVFRSILDEVTRQTLHLKAYHTASTVQANYNEVFCYLYPSTGRSPKTSVVHPTQEQLDAVRDRRILEDEREIYFDDLYNKKTGRERLAYLQKLENGTAWADKDDGLSLQRQREIKVMLGYLPKGNSEIYAARGDVDIPAPFRASHPTSVERWTHPPETNLEQASRGAAALGKRLSMSVSEMHDRQETPDNPTTLDRFYYRLQGPALEAGEFKEALGLKRNRKVLPRQAPGWATLGMAKNPPEEPGYAAK